MGIWADRWIPRLVLAPSLAASLLFVYIFLLVTGYLSFTPSRLLPNYTFAGLDRYRELFANDVWWTAAQNLAWFSIPFILISMCVGLLLALLLDQQIRQEGALRAIYLYPLALSQIVAGTAWQWMLNPGLGIEHAVRILGFPDFKFDWITDPDRAIFCVVIAAVWQCAGFVTALFLAGLRGVDEEIVKAAQVDGATMPTIYRRVIIPCMRPVFFSVMLILSHLAIKTFDLVVALTAGGPGNSSWMPANFMYTFAFERGRLGIGAASAMMMLVVVVAVLVPMMYMETRNTRDAS
ncbi:MAG: sugar ABC transporter permease [Betaproteobacteria bacterium]